MPDRWGRPTLEDGLQVAQFVNQIKAGARAERAEKRTEEEVAREKLERDAYNEYAGMISSGKNPEQELGPEKVNHAALAKAYADSYQRKAADASFRLNEMQLSSAKAIEAKRKFAESLGRAEALAREGRTDDANTHYVQAYQYINNGHNLQYDPKEGKTYEMEVDEKTGELVRGKEFKLPSPDKIREMARDMLDKNNFEQLYISNRLQNKASNAVALQNLIEVVDKSGKRAGWMVKGVNPDTGMPDWKVSLEGTAGVDMDYADALRKGYKTREDWESEEKGRLERTKAGVDIQRVRKGIDKEAAEATSPEEKLANLLIKSGKAKTLSEAVDMVMEGKAKSDKFRILADTIKDELWDLSDSGDKAAFDQLAEKLGLGDYFKTSAKGAGAQEQSDTGTVRKGKDGKTYKAVPEGTAGARKGKDGKWYVEVK